MRFSLIFVLNVFQLFQPIGGVGARFGNFWQKTSPGRNNKINNSVFFIFYELVL
jgi:hypothetical protein